MPHDCIPSRKAGRRAVKGAGGFIALMGLLLVAAPEAQAYVGPGAGITAIGSLLALLAGILFAIIGFVWYPIKRLRRRRREKQLQEASKT